MHKIINLQPIEKRVQDDGLQLDVHSIFPTIQGEGPYSGRPAVFIRLAGCNLQCPACDTEYTSGRMFLTLQEILTAVAAVQVPGNLVVITGGEPFRQNITPLCRALYSQGCWIQVETNGSLPPSPDLPPNVVIVCSPKTPQINKKLSERVNYYKYVLDCESVDSDGLPILALENSTPNVAAVHKPPVTFQKNKIYLQPMDPKDDAHYARNVKAVTESCMMHGFMLQLQVHKLIGVE